MKAASNAWLFLRNRTALRPTLDDLSREAIRRALSQGGLFFLTQVVALVLYNTDNVVIARVLGARSVTHYAVTWNLFAYANNVVGLAYPHLWAAHSEAIARGDGVWAARTLWRSLQASFAVNALLVLPLILFGREIIRLWAGPDAVPPQALIGWMGAWSLILGPSTCLTSFLNASGKLGVQIVSGLLLFSPANILLSIAWAGRFGTPGVIAATVATYLAFWLAPCLVVAHRTARSLQTAVPSGQVA